MKWFSSLEVIMWVCICVVWVLVLWWNVGGRGLFWVGLLFCYWVGIFCLLWLSWFVILGLWSGLLLWLLCMMCLLCWLCLGLVLLYGGWDDGFCCLCLLLCRVVWWLVWCLWLCWCLRFWCSVMCICLRCCCFLIMCVILVFCGLVCLFWWL